MLTKANPNPNPDPDPNPNPNQVTMLKKVKAGVLRIQCAARRRAATLERWRRFVSTRGGRMRSIELGMHALLTLTLTPTLTLTLTQTLTLTLTLTTAPPPPRRRARAAAGQQGIRI